MLLTLWPLFEEATAGGIVTTTVVRPLKLPEPVETWSIGGVRVGVEVSDPRIGSVTTAGVGITWTPTAIVAQPPPAVLGARAQLVAGAPGADARTAADARLIAREIAAAEAHDIALLLDLPEIEEDT